MDINTEVLKVVPSTTPAAALTANGVTTGATIDTQGYNGLTFVVSTGVVTDGTFTGLVYGGDASNMSDEVVLTAAQLIGSAPAIATTDDGVCERVGVNLAAVRKRYYRLKLTQAGATTGAFITAQAILTMPASSPVAAP
jgi:hypothetical protein